jgi:hypothetical protein
MSKAKNQVLDRMTSAKLSPVFTIPLDQIKVQPEHFRHRADADLDQDKGSMQALMKSLTTGGQREPLIVYRVVAKDGTVSYILWPGTGVSGRSRFWRKRTLLASHLT